MTFADLPLLDNFLLDNIVYTKICPIYSSCCTVKYNAKGPDGFILLDLNTEVSPKNLHSLCSEKPTQLNRPIQSFSFPDNLFSKGQKMLLRSVPNGAKFISGDEILQKIQSDQVKRESGEIIKMNKNTNVELLTTMEEMEELDNTQEMKNVVEIQIDDPPLEINSVGDTNHKWNILENAELGDEELN